MAEHKQLHQQAGVQHLVHLQQTQRQSPTVGDHNPWAAEAALEAHLQQGLVAVQDLERQRLQPQHLAVNPLDQLKVSQHYKGT